MLAITAVLLPLILDQITKLLAIEHLQNKPPVPVIPGLLQLAYAENTGAAWGMLQDHTAWLALLSVGATVVTTIMIVQAIRHGAISEVLAFAILTGGIIGNAIDRIARGAVVDFIDFHVRNWHWPTFNVADTAITIGVTLVVLRFWGQHPKPDATENDADR